MTRMTELDACTVPLSGTQLIEASAGTGKTYTIATLYLRLIVERGLPVDQVLVTTFTRKATRELKGRLRARLQEALSSLHRSTPASDPTLARLMQGWDPKEALPRLRMAVQDADRLAVFTLDGFCQRTLQEFAFESGAALHSNLVESQDRLIQECVADDWAETMEDAPPELVKYVLHKRPKPLRMEEILKDARLIVQTPSAEILPDADQLLAPTELEAALQRWTQAREAACAIWCSERPSILAQLDNPGLYKRPFNETNIRSWVDALDQHLKPSPTGSMLLGDWLKYLTPEGLKVRNGFDRPEHAFFESLRELRAAQGSAQACFDRWPTWYRRRLLGRLPDRIAKAKASREQIGFSDLSQGLASALSDERRGPLLTAQMRKKYAAVLVDEFQDTNALQFEIIERAFGHESALFLIGDPKQAIYGFRGADIFAYLKARERASAAHTLPINYRSDPSLLRGISCFFDHPNPFVLDEVQFHDVTPSEHAEDRMDQCGSPIQVRFIPRDGPWGSQGKLDWHFLNNVLPQQVAQEIVRVLQSEATIDGKPVQPHDIAVLTASNAQAKVLHQALSQLHVPASMDGDASVLKTEEATEVETLLTAWVDPRDERAMCTVLATRLFGLGAQKILEVREDDRRWTEWLGNMTLWREIWQRQGFLPAFRTMLRVTGTPQRLLAQMGGERALTNHLHIADILQDVQTEQSLGPSGLLGWLREAMRKDVKPVGVGKETSQIRLESEAGAVRLLTAHLSKGLEFPIVFAPFHASCHPIKDEQIARFHLEDNPDQRTLDLGSPNILAHRALHRRDRLAEDLRLLYVAMTRAKHQLYLYWGALYNCDSSALSWLMCPPKTPCAPEQAVPELRTRMSNVNDADLWGMAETIANRSQGAIEVQALSTRPVTPWSPPAQSSQTVHTRTLRREDIRALRVGSFSSLTRDKPHEVARHREHEDEHPARALPLTPGQRVLLADFPAGRHTGLCLHEILEHIDFTRDDKHSEIVTHTLQKYGFDDQNWTPTILQFLQDFLHAPLAGDAPALHSLPASERLDEMKFTFAVRPESTPFTASVLARAMATRTDVPWGPLYADTLENLSFEPLTGAFTGTMDLAFRHQGRFWVVDYKSNRLGDQFEHYHPESLLHEMTRHHYLLQAHLYVLALHRMLRLKMPGYDYDQHIGGYRYTFMRGMHPRQEGFGVFADRPNRACIEALDQAMEGS